MYKQKGGKRLSRWVDNRAGIALLMASDIKANRDVIAQLTQTAEWRAFKTTKHQRKVDEEDGDKTNGELGELVEASVTKDEWWVKLDQLIEVYHECYTILRMADSNIPAMHEIFKRMAACSRKYEENCPGHEQYDASTATFGRTQSEMKVIMASFKDRWDLLHNPLHSAGFVLGPGNRKVNQWCGLTWDETLEYIRMYYGENTKKFNAARDQLVLWKRGAGCFAKPGCFDVVDEMGPTAWWECYGSGAPELQEVALVVLSQVIGVGAAERNWKVHMHEDDSCICTYMAICMCRYFPGSMIDGGIALARSARKCSFGAITISEF